MLENVKQNFEQVLESEKDSAALRELSLSVDTFYAIASAAEVGLFKGLREPKSALELAENLSLHAGITNKLCEALASMGYLTKQGEVFGLTDLSRTFLVDSSPYYQGNLIKLMKRTRESRWQGLSKALKNGPIEVQTGFQVFDSGFSLAMAEGSVNGSLQRTIRVLRDKTAFQRAERCLDLGGCHGLYSLAFTTLNPQLSATIFDLPQVVDAVTRKVVSGSDRITVLAGDFNRDELGQGYDFVFASDVLYRPEEALRPLLLKIRESLNQGGLLISKHYHIDDLLEDSAAVLFDLMFSISGTGSRVYSTADLSRLLENCGFSVVHVEDIGSSVSRSKIIIAQKV
jgi:hypothetical protein